MSTFKKRLNKLAENSKAWVTINLLPERKKKRKCTYKQWLSLRANMKQYEGYVIINLCGGAV